MVMYDTLKWCMNDVLCINEWMLCDAVMNIFVLYFIFVYPIIFV